MRPLPQTKPSCLTKKASPTPNDRSRSPSPEHDQQEANVLIPSETLISQESQETSHSELPLQPKIDTTIEQPAEENADDFDDFDQPQTQNNDHADNDDDAFGDDFDDFEEGGADQADGDEDDDFGDFDDGFQQAEEPAVAAPPPQPVQQPLAHLVSSSAKYTIARKAYTHLVRAAQSQFRGFADFG